MATPDGLTLLDHITNLAHQLKMNSIAEGVESETTLKYLMGIGCEQAQGYYISKPLDLSSFVKFINQEHDWDVSKEGAIYKTIIDYTDWVRKVTSSLYIDNRNVRIIPDEPENTPTGAFLCDVVKNTDLDHYEELYTLYKKSFEVAKMLLSAQSSYDQDMLNSLLPDFLKVCGDVHKLLYKAYSSEIQTVP